MIDWYSHYDAWLLLEWETWLDNWFFVVAMLFLAFELLLLAARRRISWNILGDTVTNFITLALFIAIGVVSYGFYIGILFLFYQYFSFIQLPLTLATIAICIVLADLTYYWEHRAMHRFGIGWATHTVHHSSPHFNISVAYRFGPLDGIIPVFFHIPLAIAGFHPFLIIFAELIVQLYQTLLHTETVKKLPKPIEAVMNTPSHHRVHHGSNPQYIDKNYGGILIIWDRMFGTFEPEKEKVIYGIVPPLNSINPIQVFCHGLTALGKKMYRTQGLGSKLTCLIKPPH